MHTNALYCIDGPVNLCVCVKDLKAFAIMAKVTQMTNTLHIICLRSRKLNAY